MDHKLVNDCMHECFEWITAAFIASNTLYEWNGAAMGASVLLSVIETGHDMISTTCIAAKLNFVDLGHRYCLS